jgi:hypothetical protein
MSLGIDAITLDSELQPRVKLDDSTVARYVEALQRGDKFPAVTVFYDGGKYWLADGFHRVSAAKQAGIAEIEVEIRDGGKKEALLFSVAANEEHGLPRTQADRRKAVTTLLKYPDLNQLSDREIGRLCRVDHKTVAKYRNEVLSGEFPSEFVHSQEVVDFFGGNLWLTTYLFDKVSAVNADFHDDMKHIVVPEVRRTVQKLKALGLQEISGPITIWGTSKKGIMIRLYSLWEGVWWVQVFDSSNATTTINADGEEEIRGDQAYGNSHHFEGFDELINFMFQNGGAKVLPSRMDDLFLGAPPDVDKEDFPFWDNPEHPVMDICPDCGKTVRVYGKNGMHRIEGHRARHVCPACYAKIIKAEA